MTTDLQSTVSANTGEKTMSDAAAKNAGKARVNAKGKKMRRLPLVVQIGAIGVAGVVGLLVMLCYSWWVYASMATPRRVM